MKYSILLLLLLLSPLARGQNIEGRIIKVDGDKIYINLHHPNVEVSDVLSVFSNGGYVAQIEITAISSAYSVGKIVGDASTPLTEKMIILKSDYSSPATSNEQTADSPVEASAPQENYSPPITQNAPMQVMSNSADSNYASNETSFSTPDVSEKKTEYQDGIPYQYYVNNGLTISLTNAKNSEYGKWFRIDIVIQNNTEQTIDFDPISCITAYSIDKDEKQTDLDVWAYERYMKKVNKVQMWNALGVGLTEGLAAAGAGYSTSTTTTTHYNGVHNNHAPNNGHGNYDHRPYSGSVHTTTRTTTTYDAGTAYQAQAIAQNNVAAFSDSQWNISNAIQMGYLKRNTIYSGQSIAGYVLIQRKTGKALYVTITVNGANYKYAWSY